VGRKLERYTQEYKFEGEDTPYPGLVVELNLNVSLELYWKTIVIGGDDFTETVTNWGDKVLVSWNCEDDDGNAIPATGRGLLSQPFHLVRFLIGEWRSAAVNPPPPLSQRPANGRTSAGRSKKTAAA
jgi:hypothetical protein